MEFILRPKDPPVPVPKTPYVCQERYDALPFLSYPAQKGKPGGSEASFDFMEHSRHETLYPTPIRE